MSVNEVKDSGNGYYIGEDLSLEEANSETPNTITQVASSIIGSGSSKESEPIMILSIQGYDSVENLHRKRKEERTNEVAIDILGLPENGEKIFLDDSCKLRHKQLKDCQKTSNYQDIIKDENVELVAEEYIDGSRKVNTKPWSIAGALSNLFSSFFSDIRLP